MSETSSRLLELLSLLQARRDWPGSELADRLEVSGRTIRRDIDRLRGLGYPVDSLTGPAGGYSLRAGSAMPPLLLDDEEAMAIAIGLRTATRASVTGIEETAVRALVKPAPTGLRFAPRKLPAKDAAAFVQQHIAGRPNRFEARVTLLASAEEMKTRVPAYWGTFVSIDEHTCEYTSGDDNLGWLALRIAMLGVDFEVHEPPELIEHLRALADRLSRAAG